jgi:hypothetical protein
VCYTIPSVTVEPDCTGLSALLGFSSTCTRSDFVPRAPDYVAVNLVGFAALGLGIQSAVSVEISKDILTSPSSDDIFVQVSTGGVVALGFGESVSLTMGWVNGPYSSPPTDTPADSQTNNFVDHCTISGGGGIALGLGAISLGGGYEGVDSPGGDPGFTSGIELSASAGVAVGRPGIVGMVGMKVNYAQSLSELGVPLSSKDLQAYKDLFIAGVGGSVPDSTLANDAITLLDSIPGGPQTVVNDVNHALAAAQALNSACGKL